MKKRLYRITAAALMMTMLAASIVRMFKVVIWRGRFFGGNKHGRFGKAGSGNRIKSLNSPGRSSAEG